MGAFRGHIRGGVVVLDGAPNLPDGTAVTVRIERKVGRSSPKQSGQALEKLAGLADLPADIAERHDHYRRTRKAG